MGLDTSGGTYGRQHGEAGLGQAAVANGVMALRGQPSRRAAWLGAVGEFVQQELDADDALLRRALPLIGVLGVLAVVLELWFRTS